MIKSLTGDKRKVQLKDKIKIKKKTVLADNLGQATLYYTPLIGPDGVGLYLALNSLDGIGYDVDFFIKLLALGNIHNFQNTIKKVVSVGLISLYKKHDQDSEYLFLVNNPLNYDDFFSTPLLIETLKEKMGDSFSFLKKKPESLKGYEEIVIPYDKAYKRIKEQNFYTSLKGDVIRIEKFNYALFINMFDQKIIPYAIFDDKVICEAIVQSAILYNLSEHDMYSVIMNIYNIGTDFTADVIVSHAKKYYQEVVKGPVLETAVKESDDYLASIKDDKVLTLINYLNRATTEELLRSITKMMPVPKDLEMFKKIKEKTGFSQGLLNALITYVYRLKKGERVSETYYLTIASEWKASKVNNTLDGFYKISSLDKTPKKQSSFKQIKKETPNWYKESENLDPEAIDINTEGAIILDEIFGDNHE